METSLPSYLLSCIDKYCGSTHGLGITDMGELAFFTIILSWWRALTGHCDGFGLGLVMSLDYERSTWAGGIGTREGKSDLSMIL